MMELTMGWIILGISVVGVVVCAGILAATVKLFPRQREKLLREIEKDQEKV